MNTLYIYIYIYTKCLLITTHLTTAVPIALGLTEEPKLSLGAVFIKGGAVMDSSGIDIGVSSRVAQSSHSAKASKWCSRIKRRCSYALILAAVTPAPIPAPIPGAVSTYD